MYGLFLICALAGGTALVVQLALTLMGIGEVDDLDLSAPDDAGTGLTGEPADIALHDHAAMWFFGMLSLRTLTAAAAFFGIGGLAALSAGWEPWPTLLTASASGGAALYLVHWVMQSLFRLQADGTTRVAGAIGATGTVYVRIPGQRSGSGKIQVTVQNRTVELQALTDHEALPTGAKVVVTGVVSDDTVEVAPVSELQPAP